MLEVVAEVVTELVAELVVGPCLIPQLSVTGSPLEVLGALFCTRHFLVLPCSEAA